MPLYRLHPRGGVPIRRVCEIATLEPSISAPTPSLSTLWPSAPSGMSIGPPYPRAHTIPCYFMWGGVPKCHGGIMGIWRFSVLCGTSFKKIPRRRWLISSPAARSIISRAGQATKAMEVDRVPMDECSPPASLGGLHGRRWDPVGQAMRKTCAAQCCRGSLVWAFSIAGARPPLALGGGGEVSLPPRIVQLRIAASISRGGQCRSNIV